MYYENFNSEYLKVKNMDWILLNPRSRIIISRIESLKAKSYSMNITDL